MSTRSVGQAQVLQIALTSADAAERAAVDALFEALLRADADTQLLLAVSRNVFRKRDWAMPGSAHSIDLGVHVGSRCDCA